MPLFGRDQELRDVHALIAKAGEGGGALLVLGEAGIGKSSIFAAATDRASELGMLVGVRSSLRRSGRRDARVGDGRSRLIANGVREEMHLRPGS